MSSSNSHQNSNQNNRDSSSSYDAEKLQNVVEDLLKEASSQGASAAEAGLSVESDFLSP